MRIRPNSVLADLSQDQLHELYDWIAAGDSYREVQKRCALPPPEGFGLRVHLNTLNYFFRSERARRHAEELAQLRYHQLTDTVDPEQLLQNVKIELAHACYDLANHTDHTAVNSLSRITHRLDRIKLDQQRIAIEIQRVDLERDFLAEKKRQFNLNVAAEASIHAHEIKEVYKNKTGDLQQKLEQVNDIIFGPPSNPDAQTISTDEKSSTALNQ
jgi:hypothetical protein